MLSNSSILELAEEPHGWQPGDRLVVASTDYSMHQAEEFTILPCLTCTANQVKVQGMISTGCPAAPALLELLLQLLTERADFLSWFPLLPFPHVTTHTSPLWVFFHSAEKSHHHSDSCGLELSSSGDSSSSCILLRWPKSRVLLRLFSSRSHSEVTFLQGLCF